MKTIVTHISPDLDAFTACWLIKRFMPNWNSAEIKYIPAGSVYSEEQVDSNPDIIHVDTGHGQFDHHQTSTRTSATKLVFDHLVYKDYISPKNQPPLVRLVQYVNETDHFAQVYYPEADSDRYDFSLPQIIEGLKPVVDELSNLESLVFQILDAQLYIFHNKVNAERALKTGYVFTSSWGKSIVIESGNGEVLNLALKKQYHLAIKRDPKNGSYRIKTLPGTKYDLTKLYLLIKERDKKATWFLHISKNMLLNGSAKNPTLVPSRLTLQEMIAIVKAI